MKALVVFDSYFGNTEKVAASVGQALGAGNDVAVKRISEATPADLSGVQLLVVGSPTRAFSASEGTRAWLKTLPSLSGVRAAAFDTRAEMTEKTPGILRFLAGIFGYAAKPIAGNLKKKGAVLVGEPAGFFVLDSEGPLKDGELERAAGWAHSLVQ